jgi:hypothetical protein
VAHHATAQSPPATATATAFGAVSTENARDLPIDLCAFRVGTNPRLPNLGSRCKGMSASLDQMPWRSGSLHGVIGADPVFNATVGGLPAVAGLYLAPTRSVSDATATVVTNPANRNNRCCFSVIDTSCGSASVCFRVHPSTCQPNQNNMFPPERG